MIEIILDVVLLVYLTTFIVIFTFPPIIGMAVNGIEGLKDMWDMIKDKDYYIHVVKPVFIMITFMMIVGFLIGFLFKYMIIK